jgi:hypothetical protein
MACTKFQKTSKERITRNLGNILDLGGIRTVEIPDQEERNGDDRYPNCLYRHCVCAWGTREDDVEKRCPGNEEK